MKAIEDDTFYLLTKEYPEKIGLFRMLGRFFKRQDYLSIPILDPIETILKVLKKALHISYNRKVIKAIDSEDDVYGSYPKLLVNHYVIPRARIIPFLEEAFPLRQDFTINQRKVIEQLHHLCINKLHVSIVKFQYNKIAILLLL